MKEDQFIVSNAFIKFKKPQLDAIIYAEMIHLFHVVSKTLNRLLYIQTRIQIVDLK